MRQLKPSLLPSIFAARRHCLRGAGNEAPQCQAFASGFTHERPANVLGQSLFDPTSGAATPVRSASWMLHDDANFHRAMAQAQASWEIALRCVC
jgi:hypothetical protein